MLQFSVLVAAIVVGNVFAHTSVDEAHKSINSFLHEQLSHTSADPAQLASLEQKFSTVSHSVIADGANKEKADPIGAHVRSQQVQRELQKAWSDISAPGSPAIQKRGLGIGAAMQTFKDEIVNAKAAFKMAEAAIPKEAAGLAEAAVPKEAAGLAEAAIPKKAAGLAEAVNPKEAAGLAEAVNPKEAAGMAEAVNPKEAAGMAEAANPGLADSAALEFSAADSIKILTDANSKVIEKLSAKFQAALAKLPKDSKDKIDASEPKKIYMEFLEHRNAFEKHMKKEQSELEEFKSAIKARISDLNAEKTDKSKEAIADLEKQKKIIDEKLKENAAYLKIARKGMDTQDKDFVKKAKAAKVQLKSNEIKQTRLDLKNAVKKPTSTLVRVVQIGLITLGMAFVTSVLISVFSPNVEETPAA